MKNATIDNLKESTEAAALALGLMPCHSRKANETAGKLAHELNAIRKTLEAVEADQPTPDEVRLADAKKFMRKHAAENAIEAAQTVINRLNALAAEAARELNQYTEMIERGRDWNDKPLDRFSPAPVLRLEGQLRHVITWGVANLDSLLHRVSESALELQAAKE